MATDENNHKNEARDDWTGCTFRVERGPSSEGRAWGMADILTDVRRRVWPARPGISPRRPARDRARPRRRLTAPAQAFAGHADEARRVRLREIRQEGAVFRSSIQHQLATSQAMQDTVTSRELFERMPTRPALAEPEVAAHKVRSYEDDSTDWAPSGGRAAAPEQPAQPARRRPVRSTRNRDPVYTGQKTIGGTAPKRSAPLVRVGTELRFELIAKPALASHVHGA